MTEMVTAASQAAGVDAREAHLSRLSVLPAPVHMPNGMTLGHDGSLVVCEQGTRAEHARISRVDPRTGRRVEGSISARGRRHRPDVTGRQMNTFDVVEPSLWGGGHA